MIWGPMGYGCGCPDAGADAWIWARRDDGALILDAGRGCLALNYRTLTLDAGGLDAGLTSDPIACPGAGVDC